MKLDDPNLYLGICLPISSYDSPTAFWLSFVTMQKPSQYELIVPGIPSGEHAESMAHIRNELVKRALALGCTHILMLDTDQRYPQDTIEKLLSHDLPVVYAKVHRRYPPFDPILLREDIDNKGKYYNIPFEEWRSNKLSFTLQEVDSTGGGCSLFESEVFFNITYPYYRIISGGIGKSGIERRRIGEDMFLCTQRLKKAGYSIFVDLNIDIGHFTHMDADEDLYELFMRYCIDRDQRRKLEQQNL